MAAKRRALRAAAIITPAILTLATTLSIADAAQSGGTTTSGSRTASVTPMTTYVLSVDFVNAGYGGSSYTWYGGGTCDTTWYSQGSMPSGWNDVVSSFTTYADCLVNHYENSNFGGAQTGFWGTHSYIGDAMNDRTSSEKWQN